MSQLTTHAAEPKAEEGHVAEIKRGLEESEHSKKTHIFNQVDGNGTVNRKKLTLS